MRSSSVGSVSPGYPDLRSANAEECARLGCLLRLIGEGAVDCPICGCRWVVTHIG